MSTNFLYWKTPSQDQVVSVDYSSQILSGETVTAVSLGAVSPQTTPALVPTIQGTATDIPLLVLLSGGANGLSYGFQVQVTTSARVLVLQCAVTVQANADFAPYTTSNPDAYQTLMDELEAGNAAQATAFYSFPPNVDASGGFVTWEILDQDGTTYSAGNAYSYEVRTNGVSNRVKALAVITIPSTVPPTLQGQSYQIRWTLQLPVDVGVQPDIQGSGPGSQNTYYQFENIKIVGLNTVPLGVQPTVEIQGGPAHLQLVTSKMWDNVTIEIWASGTSLGAAVPIPLQGRTSDGFLYEAVFDTSALKVSLVPYTVVWRYWSSAQPSMQYQESTELFVTNPSMMMAVMDVRAFIQKAATSLYGTPDMIFPDPTIMLYLRRGCDYFNGAYGQFTNFTMTNALGPIREFWLVCAEKIALEAQYGAEGEKAFNFQGQAITLDVDRTSYLDNMIGKLQSQLDNELKTLKVNLIIKGNTSGDGSANPSVLQVGAVGAVGITLTAASMWGRGYSFAPTGLR